MQKQFCVHVNVRAEPFYVHESQCTQILNLSSPVIERWQTDEELFDILLFKYYQGNLYVKKYDGRK